ncbi:peptide ABC transporter permease [Micromonospora wenchangensis]|uniref:Peptide ABC transporter permease n=1 Tax=Micromonospora wenchangensis TaxID=1185415 RepID=A0A246RKB1_9ACTN|nr:ABC transporter permease [Micromonospora wenchangensis]OWV05806.1 peptide ABC transporter permease [Micromonospora wenchangensis]
MTTLLTPVAATLPRARPALIAAWAVLGLLALAALWPDLLATAPPDAVDPASALAPIGPDHPFGADQLGRDVYSRVVHGARLSLLIGLGATTIAVSVGALLGVLAATAGRTADEVLMRITDVLLAFPGLLLALLVIAVLGPGPVNTTIALGLAAVPGYVRLSRGQALVVRESGYVRAAVVLGRSRAAIFFRHVLPNALPPVLVFATVDIGTALMASTSLSFLGLGPQPPTPEWGSMLAEGRDYLDSAWGLTVFPGLVVTVAVIACYVVGAHLRARFEGRTPGGR